MKNFHFEKGVVIEIDDYDLSALIKLESSEIVKTKSADLYILSLKKGQEVFVSWRSVGRYPRKWRGVYYIDPDAVENKNQWHRFSGYKRRFPKDKRLSFKTEEIMLQKLLKAGIRTESATDFEDECLGIDFWIFVKSSEKWVWLPINITLRKDMNKFATNSKYDRSFKKGVIPIQIYPDELGHDNLVVYFFEEYLSEALEDFTLCGRKLITREEAMIEEVRKFPIREDLNPMTVALKKAGLLK